MKRTNLMNLMIVALLALLMNSTASVWAQDKPASNLEIIHEKLKADKNLIVAKYMELTQSESGKFWPVYEQYQNDLQTSNERLRKLLENYAADYKSLTDDTRVTAHSIIAVLGTGPITGKTDGVVAYESAHIDGVASEVVVRSPHSTQGHPETIEEVRRILREHIGGR